MSATLTITFSNPNGQALSLPPDMTLGPSESKTITIQASANFTGTQELEYLIKTGADEEEPGSITVTNLFPACGGGGGGGDDVFFDSEGAIWAVPLDGSADPRLILQLTDQSLDGVGVSASGGTLLFSGTDASDVTRLWRANSDGNNHGIARAVSDNWLQLPAFFDDAKYAWSQGDDSDDGDIWYADAAGLAHQLTGSGAPDGFIDYDPSFGGTDVIFFSRHYQTMINQRLTQTSDIYRVSLSGGAPVAVAENPAVSEDHPSYANNRIVFEQASDDYSRDDIWVMNADGTGREPVTSDTRYDNDDPVWSPDGQWIVWERGFPDDPDTPFVDESDGPNWIVKIAWPLQDGDTPSDLTDPAKLDARRPAMKPR